MKAVLNDPIKIAVIFSPQGIRPVWFIRRGQRHHVTQVTMQWQTQEGSASILHVGATDGTHLFELALNQETLIWQLVSIETNGT